ncbi:MAG: prephenate dehydrogenase [Chthoniobacterales bacterium]
MAPGLIGASLGLALKKYSPATRIHLWGRSEENLRQAEKLTRADRASTNLAEVAAGVDVAVLCCPVEAMPSLGKSLHSLLPQTAIVTDAGSVKSPVIAAMEPIFGERFIGAHPMAGSEQSGCLAASPELFQSARCLLTPTKKTAATAIEVVGEMWARVGAQIISIDVEKHDAVVARISHLPHLAAAALVTAATQNDQDNDRFAGSGYRDATRIAAGPADMWTGIIHANRREISLALREYIEILKNLEQNLHDTQELSDTKELKNFLQNAGDQRKKLSTTNLSSPNHE